MIQVVVLKKCLKVQASWLYLSSSSFNWLAWLGSGLAYARKQIQRKLYCQKYAYTHTQVKLRHFLPTVYILQAFKFQKLLFWILRGIKNWKFSTKAHYTFLCLCNLVRWKHSTVHPSFTFSLWIALYALCAFVMLTGVSVHFFCWFYRYQYVSWQSSAVAVQCNVMKYIHIWRWWW